ncbi:hypothetical protein BC835DRAFT_1394862, partial [Cytidiella melzeri]
MRSSCFMVSYSSLSLCLFGWIAYHTATALQHLVYTEDASTGFWVTLDEHLASLRNETAGDKTKIARSRSMKPFPYHQRAEALYTQAIQLVHLQLQSPRSLLNASCFVKMIRAHFNHAHTIQKTPVCLLNLHVSPPELLNHTDATLATPNEHCHHTLSMTDVTADNQPHVATQCVNFVLQLVDAGRLHAFCTLGSGRSHVPPDSR